MNIRSLLIFLPVIILTGCSSSRESTSSDNNERIIAEISPGDKQKLAMEYFIDGSIAELNYDYQLAIANFKKALALHEDAGIYYAIAKSYFYQTRAPQALQNIKKAIELDPVKKDYYDLLSDILIAARQYDSAATALNKIIQMDSSDIGAYYKLARIYEYSRPLQAVHIYNKLTGIIGPDWSVLIRVAELYEKIGNVPEASRTVEQLLTLDPSNVNLQKLLSELYLRNLQFEKAATVLDGILELTPDDLDARERKARILLDQGKWDEAGIEYSILLQQPDVSLELKIRVAGAYFEQSIKDSSLTEVTKEMFESIEADTNDWQVKMYLGAIAINEGKDSAAIAYFDAAAAAAPWNVQAWIRLGGLYFDNRRYDEAIFVMNEAIESFPEDFAINLILGLSLAQKDNHTEARPYLEKAVKLNPTDITALSSYGYTLSQLKESDKAIEILNRALRLNPDNVYLLGTLGLIYNSLQLWEDCDSVYTRAVELDSLNATINNNFAYSLAERGIRLDYALAMAEIAVEAEPENPSFLDTIGWVHFKLGNFEDAKKFLEKAIEVGGERAVMLDHLGDVLFRMGKKEKAIELWQKALDLDTSNNEIKTKLEKGEI